MNHFPAGCSGLYTKGIVIDFQQTLVDYQQHCYRAKFNNATMRIHYTNGHKGHPLSLQASKLEEKVKISTINHADRENTQGVETILQNPITLTKDPSDTTKKRLKSPTNVQDD